VRNLQSITIDPVNSSIAAGTTLQLHATGHYKNKTTKNLTDKVTWSSSTASVANVSNAAGSQGLVTGGSAGATTITVTLNGRKGVSTFTVTKATLKSITLFPVNPFVAKGTTVQLGAKGNFSDGSIQDLTTQVSWSSANAGIAQVSNTSGTLGLVTGVAVGNTPIAATFKGVSGTTTVTVTAAALTSISITVPNASIAKGTSAELTATCTFSDGTTQDCTGQATCTSGNSGIVQVGETSPTEKQVTGIDVGSTSISCTVGGIQGSSTQTVTAATLTSITITPPNPSIPAGIQQQLTAIGNFSDKTTQDLTTQVSWSQDDATIAQVSNITGTQGLVTGLSVGSTPITATLNGITGSTTVNVTVHIVTSITVLPADPSLAKGATEQLSATCNFSDNTTGNCTSQASWTPGNPAVAQVSSFSPTEGLVTGTGVGSTSITATLNGVQGSTTVTVTAAIVKTISITVNPPTASIPKGLTVQLTAVCNFSDGTTSDCTTAVGWAPDPNNLSIASVSNDDGSQGLVTGNLAGTANISATLSGVTPITSSVAVTVTNATLVSIAVTAVPPGSLSFPAGLNVQLMATGTFSDNSHQDLTGSVSWNSSDPTTATVGLKGLVHGTAAGSTTITAAEGGISGNTTVTVTAAALESITVAPQNSSIAQGTTVHLVATGHYSDGTTHDITADASWTSSNDGIATVGNAGSAAGAGVVTGVTPGSVTIKATVDGISSAPTTTVTVTAATVSKLIIATVFNPPPPVPASISVSLTVKELPLIATAVFSDGSVQDVTQQTHWISSDHNVASIISSSSTQTNGRMDPKEAGTTTITGTVVISGTTFQGMLVVNVTM
jgi:uncharacterized protein YjdB